MTDTVLNSTSRRPRFRRTEEAPSFQITQRDIDIVRQVARHRFLRSTHISQLLDSPHKKICERLTLLYHAGYLDRPRSQLEYHVRSGGSTPYVYELDNQGAQLLKEHVGFGHLIIDWGQKYQDSTRQFLLHALSVADFRVALAVACRARPDLRLLEPNELLRSAPEQTQQNPTPWSWRVRVQFKGQITEIGVIPDYVFALILPDGRRRPFVVECDRGTMPIERATLAQTSMLRKFLAYEATRVQAIHSTRFAWANFRVLIITTSEERQECMCKLIDRAVGTSPLFLFAPHTMLVQSDILSYLWSDALGATHVLA